MDLMPKRRITAADADAVKIARAAADRVRKVRADIARRVGGEEKKGRGTT